MLKDDIQDLLRLEKPTVPLYHYTTQAGLLGIVGSKKRSLWATHHQCLNDTQEFLHAKGLIRAEIDRCRATADSDSRSLLEEMDSALGGPGNEEVNLYIASFSEDGDSLPQWRAYGGQTAGFALGFWGDRLVLPERFTMARCIYNPEKQYEVAKAIVAEVLEIGLSQMPTVGSDNAKLGARFGLLLNLHRFALFFKHKKFEGEKEWRIISPVLMDFKPAYSVQEETELAFRQGRSMLIPYRRVPLKDDKGGFPLDSVVVGPNPNKEQSLRSVCSFLNSQGLEEAAKKSRSSDIPYRNW